jgi:hypothetical protein
VEVVIVVKHRFDVVVRPSMKDRDAVSDRGGGVRGTSEHTPTRGVPEQRRMIHMHYLVSVIDDTPDSASSEEMTDIDAFNEVLQKDGHWVFAAGIGAPSTATVVDGRGAEAMFTDGPFVETKEWISGFWVIEARDLDVALELAAAGSKACNRRVEVRPFL